MVLGADNVGKTSLIQNTINSNSAYVKITKKHWSKPEDPRNIYQMYFDYLDNLDTDTDLFIFDRGFPETFFYSYFRDGNHSDYDDLQFVMERYQRVFNIFHTFVIKRDWKCIEQYHLKEIEDGYGYINEPMSVEDRYTEYVSYYRFIEKWARCYPRFVTIVENPPRWFKLL